ncbi:MAG: nucleoside phosphorylase [Syntrophorhabdus sp.]
MKRFFDPSEPVLTARDLVRAFTKKTDNDLALPERAIIVFNDADLRRLTDTRESAAIPAWLPFRVIHGLTGTRTVAVRSFFGGPNIAALVEELAAFGVRECILWGYCGSITREHGIGDICIAKRAFREEGISHHYLESENYFVSSVWVDAWVDRAGSSNFSPVDVWTTDAIYRETRGKIAEFARQGMAAVEMETASFYAVCNAKGLKSISFLVVSDLLMDEKWIHGFHTRQFKEGIKKLSRFITEHAIL